MGDNKSWQIPCTAKAGTLLKNQNASLITTKMKPFNNMSIPDLEITREGYKLVHDQAHAKIQQLEKEITLEATVKPLVDKLTRVKELHEIIEAEIFNQKQRD
jgi:hypothetical protein